MRCIITHLARSPVTGSSSFTIISSNSTLSPPGSPDYDQLGKVRPVAEFLSDQVAAVYELGRDISIDETMIPFKGRSSLKQYMPLKPVRGIEVWARAEASSGYVSAFQVYTGKQGDTTETGLGANLSRPLPKISRAPIDTSSSTATSPV